MPPNLLKYSNGWGHLLVTLSTQVVAVVMLLQHDATLNSIAIGLLMSVSGYWFITSSVNAHQQHAQSHIPGAPATPPTPAQGETHDTTHT
jgi:hypothetical protein